ncbi:DUF2252 domain-containing protein [uncultured Reyranella sp.]|uniref:DUF2252 domain-containing protein n=1 Tax=uncultured Reyranella sp. TaxID=735512 RepID=UPI0025F22305|nr:DUF2252 domain-containing protein [uncultured Reyranella sp.]
MTIADSAAEQISAATNSENFLQNFATRRPSPAERQQTGRDLRRKVPRREHAAFVPAPNRASPIEILEAQNASRAQKLVPVRFARMLASPFAFLRGSAAVMAADLATSPTTEMYVNACGDMHVSNFGLFGSAERQLVFAINDFDEVYPGPWEWDLKRLAASAAVAVRFMGGDKPQAFEAAVKCVRAYRKHIARYADLGTQQIWYERIDEQAVLNALKSQAGDAAKSMIAKAKAKGHKRVLEKMTEEVGGEYRISENGPLVVRETHYDDGQSIEAALDTMLHSYVLSLDFDRRRMLSRYRIVDIARKVVGVGSVGTSCWVMLLSGPGKDDPLFLQVKQAQASVLEPYSAYKLPYSHHGQRVVIGQRLVQGSPDIFLGWGEIGSHDFYVRQLADMTGSMEIEGDNRRQIDSFFEYCALCGWALALAHAKSGDAAMISGYCGKSAVLDEAIANFSVAYARQTEQDYDLLDKARRSGRIQVFDEPHI